MNGFLKKILQKDNSPIIDQGSGDPGPGTDPTYTLLIENPTMTLNNSCETRYEGNFQVPTGKTATVTGSPLSGTVLLQEGILEGFGTFVGSLSNVPAGIYKYTVWLGNSGQEKIFNSYHLAVQTNDSLAEQFFRRGATEHIFYDNPPC